ncbi:Protein tyrosine kinase [Aphelenchoides bicaudatus]|nr:Protein tyrosine kinase [Aphelenchoides bicaudatus]
MLQEIELMKQLGSHENLLTMIGYVKMVDNPVIATEYCLYGDLLKILRKHPLHCMSEERCDRVKVCLLIDDLLRIASQVCSAMIYLSSLNFVHRDIAARNVLLNDRMVSKLGDFGLCKHIDELLMDQKSGRLPVRHMPYEVLKFGRFSEKTDVWAFGVLLWEMFTGGQTALADVETEDLVHFLDQGGRPEFPASVPEEIANLTNNLCLQRDVNNRSNFVEIKEEIDKHLKWTLELLQRKKFAKRAIKLLKSSTNALQLRALFYTTNASFVPYATLLLKHGSCARDHGVSYVQAFAQRQAPLWFCPKDMMLGSGEKMQLLKSKSAGKK